MRKNAACAVSWIVAGTILVLAPAVLAGGHDRTLVLRMYERFDEGYLDAFGPSISSDFSAQVMGTKRWAGQRSRSSARLS
jgi:hypothetical protein